MTGEVPGDEGGGRDRLQEHPAVSGERGKHPHAEGFEQFTGPFSKTGNKRGAGAVA